MREAAWGKRGKDCSGYSCMAQISVPIPAPTQVLDSKLAGLIPQTLFMFQLRKVTKQIPPPPPFPPLTPPSLPSTSLHTLHPSSQLFIVLVCLLQDQFVTNTICLLNTSNSSLADNSIKSTSFELLHDNTTVTCRCTLLLPPLPDLDTNNTLTYETSNATCIMRYTVCPKSRQLFSLV